MPLKYRVDGKEKGLALGVYPDVSLKEARNRRDDARKQVANGFDKSKTILGWFFMFEGHGTMQGSGGHYTVDDCVIHRRRKRQ